MLGSLTKGLVRGLSSVVGPAMSVVQGPVRSLTDFASASRSFGSPGCRSHFLEPDSRKDHLERVAASTQNLFNLEDVHGAHPRKNRRQMRTYTRMEEVLSSSHSGYGDQDKNQES
jgi:hypothetical protein